jgi:hypothetical protein
MGCCVVTIALISQLFALWRKLRRALGLPVREWYEDGPVATSAMIWRGRFRALIGTTRGRSVLAALVVAELTFIALVAPGPHGLIAQHRQHIRQAIEWVVKFGLWPDSRALICRTKSPAAAPGAPNPPL